jgi:hypothetical protein
MEAPLSNQDLYCYIRNAFLLYLNCSMFGIWLNSLVYSTVANMTSNPHPWASSLCQFAGLSNGE